MQHTPGTRRAPRLTCPAQTPQSGCTHTSHRHVAGTAPHLVACNTHRGSTPQHHMLSRECFHISRDRSAPVLSHLTRASNRHCFSHGTREAAPRLFAIARLCPSVSHNAPSASQHLLSILRLDKSPPSWPPRLPGCRRAEQGATLPNAATGIGSPQSESMRDPLGRPNLEGENYMEHKGSRRTGQSQARPRTPHILQAFPVARSQCDSSPQKIRLLDIPAC